MSNEDNFRTLLVITKTYCSNIRTELDARWECWEKKLSSNEQHEVVGALLARQVTLASNLASAPQIWNEDVAPIILRVMADVYVTLSWILEDPQKRSQKFIAYGLGQQKLKMEHRKAQLLKDGRNPEDDPVVKCSKAWIDRQRYDFLTEVDIGNWSGLNTREMAKECGCIDFYNYVYQPWSAVVHSTWSHISMFNLKRCNNPLHRFHYVPSTEENVGVDPEYLHLAAKYLNKAFKKFDEKTGIAVTVPNSFEQLETEMENASFAEGQD